MGIWAYIVNDAQIPPPLKLALNCKQWSTLPAQGGYFDQPAKTMHQITVALNVYNQLTDYHRMMNKEDFSAWQAENGKTIELVAAIKEELNNE